MMAYAIRSEYISFAEYLAAERDSSIRHEYLNGEIYAMSGASELHNAVNAELFTSIYAHLPDECRAFMSDMKLKVEQDNKVFAYYPDIMVACGVNDGDPYTRTNPLLLVEVLSPFTRRTDLTEKLMNYSFIPSLLEYVVVHQDNPHVQIYRRRHAWQVEHFVAGDTFQLESIGLTMQVEQIYRKVRKEVGLI